MMGTAEIVTVHEAELLDPRQSGGRMRAYCHIHGGEHQRSLSIALDGDAAGYGYCHQCGAKVFVPELAPTGARGARGSSRPRRISAEALLRPPRRPSASEPTPAEWQRDELVTLARWYPRTRERLQDERARAYLAERGIPYDVAAAAGVGYIPADARLSGHMAKWRDRLIFPLASPAGAGYAGRSLHGWQPGMDENVHKALLDGDPDGPRRWEKSYPAGWLGFGELAGAEYVVICEGPVDALALMAAGLLADVPVIALVGTAARAEWVPANVRGVVLALDGDAAGQERAQTLRHELRGAGLAVAICAPTVEDGRGKDWAERWRLSQHAGVWPVSEALDTLISGRSGTVSADVPRHSATGAAPASIPLHSVTESDAGGAPPSLDALARADAVVCYLLAHGLELIEVCPAAASIADVQQSSWLTVDC